MTLFGWGKTFDGVRTNKMFEAMERLGIDTYMMKGAKGSGNALFVAAVNKQLENKDM